MINDFHFSQASLQDYADCPRRFKLRYVSRLSWPAVEAEPIFDHERHLHQGTVFHRMIQQHITGIPEDKLSGMVTDEDLSRWWRNYLDTEFCRTAQKSYPEIVLSARAGGHILIAKYDLICVNGSAATIIDWKTSKNPTERKWLAKRLQTRVYSYLLAEAGSHLNGEIFPADNIGMIYWFANFPDTPESFPYSTTRYGEDREYLFNLIEEISREDKFPKTTEEKHCKYCVYRSLCHRGVKAGSLEELDGDEVLSERDMQFDFEQIGEIEF